MGGIPEPYLQRNFPTAPSPTKVAWDFSKLEKPIRANMDIHYAWMDLKPESMTKHGQGPLSFMEQIMQKKR
jgi:hypothetical protein